MGTEATRAAYDATVEVYLERIGTSIVEGVEQPLELGLLAEFASLVGSGRVADLGCGPGRMCKHLRAFGLESVGLDLSGSMLSAARRLHPHAAWIQADIATLPMRDGCFDGAALWYSIIHSPADLLPSIFTEVRRIVVGGAPLILGFQCGEGELVHRSEVGGHSVSLTNVRHSPSTVTKALADAGFDVISVTVREPVAPLESTRQAFVLARASA